MKIIGLSGGVASGKNLVAEIFAKNGAAIFDADKEVHKLLELDKSTISRIKKSFPECFLDKKINRQILGKIVFHDVKKLKILEEIIHPQVRKNYDNFLKEARKNKVELVILNIPLLLETQHYKCDKILVIISSKELRKERFLEREKVKDKRNFDLKKKDLEKKFVAILKSQLSDVKRKKHADFIIKNNDSKKALELEIKELMKVL